ncbi:MAG: hypothetical protein IJD40_03420 [Lachnospiraceae bacterium]|nr:hypothetical protein [Lachnospiraceae bacterium]
MTLEIVALLINAIVSIVVPLIVLGVLIKQNKEQWKGVFVVFLCGGLVYIAMQWGAKEHGLTWLFNNTSLMDFMGKHYVLYLFLVALAGAMLTVLGQFFIAMVPFRKKMTFDKAISFSIGYSMVESILLVGVRSINTLVEIFKGTELELNTSAMELYLSGYERVLYLIIQMAIVLVLMYFLQHGMIIRGMLIAVLSYMIISFLPGFFIAFSLPEYLEVFSRSTTLTMVYAVLTASAVTSIIIINVCRNLSYEE